MNLYLISQDVNNGYDTYRSAVVAAEDEVGARMIHPDGGPLRYSGSETWCALNDVKVRLIGTAIEGTEEGVICASFKAG